MSSAYVLGIDYGRFLPVGAVPKAVFPPPPFPPLFIPTVILPMGSFHSHLQHVQQR